MLSPEFRSGDRLSLIETLNLKGKAKKAVAATAIALAMQMSGPPKSDHQASQISDPIHIESAEAFTDVSGSYAGAINSLSQRGVIDGYSDGTFRPNAQVTRQQFAKIIDNTLNFDLSVENKTYFTDVTKNPGSLYPDNYVAVAAETGLTKGTSETTYSPTKNITRDQLVTMVYRAARAYADAPPVSDTHEANRRAAEQFGLLRGIVNYSGWDSGKPASRGEIAQIAWNLRQRLESTRPEMFNETDNRGPNDVDVIVYGDTISAMGVVRGIKLADHTFPKIKVKIISPVEACQAPVANGQGWEDTYGLHSGAYSDFRNTVIRRYAGAGVKAEVNGRLGYEPNVAEKVIHDLENYPFVTREVGTLQTVSDAEGNQHVVIQKDDGSTKQINARLMMIDTSTEADLARMAGADYWLGSTQNVYNDKYGPKPAVPSPENNNNTSPQAVSALITFKMVNGTAQRVQDMNIPGYDKDSYDPSRYATWNTAAFKDSWSMKTPLPYGKHELNEPASDYKNPARIYDYYFGAPEDKRAVYNEALTQNLHRIRYLQEHGYPNLQVTDVPDMIYSRSGPRIKGEAVLDGYNPTGVDSIALGYYAKMDYHDVNGWRGDVTAGYTHVPARSTVVVNHPNLAVTQAISATISGANSAVRMEPTRANIGEAVGVGSVIAKEKRLKLRNIFSSWLSSYQTRAKGIGLLTKRP